MNKLTLIALLGVSEYSAHPHFFKMIQRHKHHHKHHHDNDQMGNQDDSATHTFHGKHHKHHDHKEPTWKTPYDFLPIKGKVPDEQVQCEFKDGDILPEIEFWRTLIGGTYKSFVQGWYNSEEPIISDECAGDWMDPMIEFQKDFHHQIKHDPMSTTIEDAHTAANNFVDLHWKNRDLCQVSMVKDDFYNWCLDNEEVCLGKDGQFWTRMYQNGYSVFGKFYDLAGIFMFEKDECYTDAQMIDEHNRVVTDLASLLSYIMGYSLDYDPERVEQHYTFKQFKHGVRDFFNEKYQQAQDAIEFQQNAQKDIFGADGHDMWMPTADDIYSYMPETPTADDIYSYMPETPVSYDYEITISDGIPVPKMPEMPPMPDFGHFPERPNFPAPPSFDDLFHYRH